MNHRAGAALFVVLACLSARAEAQSGRELIEASLRRHAQPPYVYEEQALVLSDRLGQHTVRTARYYARRDESGSKSLLMIETPAESRGTAVFITRDVHGGERRGADASVPVFGSEFSVADLEGEQPEYFRYERDDDNDLDRVPHFVLHVLPLDETVARATGYGERRIYLRKDNLFVSRIDYHDRQGRLARRQTFRDPRPDESGAWRAGMILMENLSDGRRTLLKVDRRVHSPDYVPAAVFAGRP
ncbi:MAG: outer membrane lipoprotein-sorting protein [Betaproteobacteria bacterium]|nr:outer membrane lipoprotein-sorting protein [Betaproteobacteria bacterium]